MKLWILGIFFGLGSACGVSASKYSDNTDEPELAHIVSYELDKGFMTIRVLTSGCTGVHSFKVVADSKAANRVKVLRVKQDKCRLTTRPIELQYSIRHLGLDINRVVSVLNLSSSENSGEISLVDKSF